MKAFWLIILFFAALYACFFSFNLIDGHHFELSAWVKNKESPNTLFAYPAIREIGTIGYSFVGEPFFLFFPAILFFVSISILCLAFDSFKLNKWFLCLFFVLQFKLMGYLAFFTRENMGFFFGVIYAVFFFQITYKKSSEFDWIALFLSALLGLLARETAFILLILAVCLFLYKNKARIGVIYPFLFQTTDNLQHFFNFSLSAPFYFQPKNAITFLYSNSFSISFFCFFISKDFFHALLLILTIFYCFSVSTVIGFSDIFIRYSSVLLPMHFFYIAKTIKSLKKR